MSAEPVSPAERVAAEGTTAEHALAALRRDRLVHSWQRNGTGFAIVVGRGTVRPLGLDPAGVLRLADQLRRDKVTIVGGGYAMGYRTVRYTLSDGRFADRHDSRADRYLDCRYTVYLPGGAPSGCAAVSFAARTQNDALALAGLARVRGRGTRCRALRPLHVRGWQPRSGHPLPRLRRRRSHTGHPALPHLPAAHRAHHQPRPVAASRRLAAHHHRHPVLPDR